MSSHSTHLIQHYASKKSSVLSRVADGCVIAVKQERKVAWGEDPQHQQGRVFISEQFAVAALRKIADADQSARKGLVCKDCGSAPSESVECSGNEDRVHRLEYGGIARIKEEDAESRVVRPN